MNNMMPLGLLELFPLSLFRENIDTLLFTF
jgi:hypothetical protein